MNASDLVDNRIVSPTTFGGVLSPVANRSVSIIRDRHIYLHSTPLVDSSELSDMTFSENSGDVCILPEPVSYLESAKFLGWQATELFNIDETPLKIGAVPAGLPVPYTVANIHMSPYFSYKLYIGDKTSKEVASVMTENAVQDVSVSTAVQASEVLSGFVDTEELYRLFDHGFTATVGFTLQVDLGAIVPDGDRLQGTAEARLYADGEELVRHSVIRDAVVMQTFIEGGPRYDNTLVRGDFSGQKRYLFREKKMFQIEYGKDHKPVLTLSVVLKDSILLAPARANLLVDSVKLNAPS